MKQFRAITVTVFFVLVLSGCAGTAERIEGRIAERADQIFDRIPKLRAEIIKLQTLFDKLLCSDFQWMKRYAAKGDVESTEMENVCGVIFTKTKAVARDL